MRWTEAEYQSYLNRRPDRPSQVGGQVEPREPSTAELVVELVSPPSINSMYANVPGKGRVLTGPAREWKQNAVLLIKVAAQRQGWYYTDERLILDIVWHFADMRPDIDGPIKALLDSFAAALGFNDRVVDKLTCERGSVNPDSPSCHVKLSFKEGKE